eukprot:CAMPEP_0184494790 /NCGR_PEP_ID=MMETSP0113_2-20130426/29580_1 /TAXON_ID=91329 /ORGANISM="Norrisiella sphaerica, Strain BC52" /LENGTH=668 /DNA_ID=CAMNT_0026880683 /DNA_START=73 /DNA_END=2076 /DNA_ORIENTATION=-
MGFILGGPSAGDKRKDAPSRSPDEIRALRLQKLSRNNSRSPSGNVSEGDTKSEISSSSAGEARGLIHRKKRSRGTQDPEVGEGLGTNSSSTPQSRASNERDSLAFDAKLRRLESGETAHTLPLVTKPKSAENSIRGGGGEGAAPSQLKNLSELKAVIADPDARLRSLETGDGLDSLGRLSGGTGTSLSSKVEATSNANEPKAKTKRAAATSPAAKATATPTRRPQAGEKRKKKKSFATPSAIANDKGGEREQEKKETWEELQDRVLRPMLKIALDQDEARRTGLTFVDMEDPQCRYVTSDNLDMVLMNRFGIPFESYDSGGSPFGYIVSCYRRSQQALKALNPSGAVFTGTLFASDSGAFSAEPEAIVAKVEKKRAEEVALRTLLDMLASYAFLSLSASSEVCTKAQIDAGFHQLERLLSADRQLSRALPPGMLHHVFFAFQDSGLGEILHPLLDRLLPATPRNRMHGLELEKVGKVGQTLVRMASIPDGAIAISTHPRFDIPPHISAGSAGLIERESLLGPLLGVALKHNDPRFANTLKQSIFEVKGAIANVQAQVDEAQDATYTVLKMIVQAAKTKAKQARAGGGRNGELKTGASAGGAPSEALAAKAKVFRFIGRTLDLNKDRRKMMYLPFTVSSSAFMVNLGGTLARLCLPFVKKRSFSSVNTS